MKEKRYNQFEEERVKKLAYEEYACELEKVIDTVFDKVSSGKIRWEKWDKEQFEISLAKRYKRNWKIELDVTEIYNRVLSEYVRVYVQQDFMKELYGYTYSSGKGDFKDYGTVLFFAIPGDDGNYDILDFLSYWVLTVLKPKYNKWVKSQKIGKEEIFQRWRPLYDVIKFYNNKISKEEVEENLICSLKLHDIKFDKITDYQICF